MVNSTAKEFLVNATKNGDAQYKRAASTLISKTLVRAEPAQMIKMALQTDQINRDWEDTKSALPDSQSDEIVPQSSKSLKPDTRNGKLMTTIANGTMGPYSRDKRPDSIDSGASKGENERDGSEMAQQRGSPMMEIAQPADDKSPPLVKIQARKVNCKTFDGEQFMVEWYLMQQSKHFKRAWEEHKAKKKGSNGRSRKFTFHMDDIDADTFRRVLDWLTEHDGMDDPVVREDPVTGDRIWFELTDFEKRFFDVPLDILNELLNAGKLLDIPSLYLFGCQSMAGLLQNKNPAEIREMLGLENDLTSTDIAMIRRKNRKFKMRELKAARYAERLQQLQSQLQHMGLRQGAQLSGSVAEQLLLAGN